MKKIIATLGALSIVLSGCKAEESASIGVIGGAHGPTAVFVTGGSMSMVMMIAGGLIVAALAVVIAVFVSKRDM